LICSPEKTYAEIVFDSLRYCQRKKGLVIHAWCLMPSHLHMIASTKGNFQLHEIFRDFKKFTATEIIKCMNEISESRKEWMLKLFAAEQRLTRITNYKV
jgi:REP element-mobilizing transposase RayT